MAWYLFAHGEVKGPFEEEVIIDWIHAGLADAKVCLEGETKWVDLLRHAPFAAALRRSQPTTPPPRQSGPVRKAGSMPPEIASPHPNGKQRVG